MVNSKHINPINFLAPLKNKNILITSAGKEMGFFAILEAIKKSAFIWELIKSKKDLKIYRKLKHIMKMYGYYERQNFA